MADQPSPKQWLALHGYKVYTGTRCWGLSYQTGKGYRTHPGLITRIGREYVVTDIFRNSRFRVQSLGDKYLTEADSNGLVDKLFLSEKDMEEYILRENLAVQFNDNARKYREFGTISQLKTAMMILDGASDELCLEIMLLINQNREGV